jgi:hypothetical protein
MSFFFNLVDALKEASYMVEGHTDPFSNIKEGSSDWSKLH